MAALLFSHVRDAFQSVLDVLQGNDFGFGFFEAQTAGVVGVEFLNGSTLGVTVFAVLEGKKNQVNSFSSRLMMKRVMLGSVRGLIGFWLRTSVVIYYPFRNPYN